MHLSTGPWRQLTERTWLATCEPAGVNVGLVVGDDHVLLIDTGSHPEQGRDLAASAARIAGRPVDRVVVTHWHWDHWFGLGGVDVEHSIGHEALDAARDHPEFVADASERGVEAVLPSRLIALAAALDLGGVRAEVVHFGPAHTAGDLAVLVPGENVVFAGDLLEEGADPSFGHDSGVRTWPAFLDGILGATNDATQFVPGHGDTVDRFFVFRQRAEIAMLFTEGERLARSGTKLEDAYAATEWPFSETTVASALELVYAELAAKGIRPRTHLPFA